MTREPDAAAERSTWHSWLAPAALVVIALHQIALAHAADLSPWKGGGYGMFSTNDHGGARFVRVWALEPGPGEGASAAGGERRVRIPPGLVNASYRLRDLPRPEALRAFGRALAREWPDAVADAPALRVEVWRTRHDPGTLEPRRERLRAVELTLP